MNPELKHETSQVIAFLLESCEIKNKIIADLNQKIIALENRVETGKADIKADANVGTKSVKGEDSVGKE